MAIIPENKKKTPTVNSMPDVFIYGASYVGKSTFADNAQDVLFINTDGNTDELLSPAISIANEVTVNGRITSTKLAWEVFKELVDELEKKQNTYKYIALDLLEDLRELCRVYIYKRMNITHESDAGFGKAYDMVTTEFNTVIKRIKAAGYHLIICSKEIEGEVTLKSGGKYTTFKPNVPDKVANQIAGLVDISARAFVDENGKRWLQLAKQDHTFGGGRYNFRVDKCELSMNTLVEEIKKIKKETK
jgi:phage nucleotide-binding protein